jgi:hypothetical protein
LTAHILENGGRSNNQGFFFRENRQVFARKIDYRKGQQAGGSCGRFRQPTDFERSGRKSDQSPCRPSTVPSLRGPCIRRLFSRHGSADPPPVRSRAWGAIASSNPQLRKAGQGSVIQSRHQPGRSLYPEASAGHISLDGSRWQGIREGMATGLPVAHAPQPVERSGRRRTHARENLPDVRKPEDCYPPRSCAPPFIAQVEDLVPVCAGEVGLESFPLEGSLPQSKPTAALPFRNSPPETLFDNGLHCPLLPLSQLTHFLVKTIWYLYGCLHMASHIIKYGWMSNKTMNCNLETIVARS